ncbi:MAG: UDP-N-acetyl glucosamine 2-epimerase [Gemmatimonadota bacterium]|nr:UDP-N-acetyl glucosamine 2-epimerase [Gemmatimonadota bacterium]
MIALCYGTRPQVIKASVLRRALATLGPVYAIDTGQHYDYALNALLYEQLGVAPPDLFLEAGSASHAEQTATILTRAEAALSRVRPRVVVVIGDTNSTLGVALAAAKLRLPVVHVEAGLRATDRLMAEEINRRMVDAIATLLCTPCEAATLRMRAEHPDATVVESGDVARDVLESVRARLPAPASIVPGLASPYLFTTLHRAELTDVPARLGEVVRALAALDLPAVLAVHPRTRAALAALGLDAEQQGGLRLVPAVGYLESLALARGAAAVVTDSGGLQREAYWLGTPCVTVRGETEWEETVALGANVLVSPGDASARLAEAVRAQVARWRGPARWKAAVYGEGHAAEKVTSAIAAMP